MDSTTAPVPFSQKFPVVSTPHHISSIEQHLPSTPTPATSKMPTIRLRLSKSATKGDENQLRSGNPSDPSLHDMSSNGTNSAPGTNTDSPAVGNAEPGRRRSGRLTKPSARLREAAESEAQKENVTRRTRSSNVGKKLVNPSDPHATDLGALTRTETRRRSSGTKPLGEIPLKFAGNIEGHTNNLPAQGTGGRTETLRKRVKRATKNDMETIIPDAVDKIKHRLGLTVEKVQDDAQRPVKRRRVDDSHGGAEQGVSGANEGNLSTLGDSNSSSDAQDIAPLLSLKDAQAEVMKRLVDLRQMMKDRRNIER